MAINNAINAIPVTTCNIQILASSGTYTPTAGMKFIIVDMIGGGGGSGGVWAVAGAASLSASGSPGSYLKFKMTAAQVGASLSYACGAAGTGGSGATSTPTIGVAGGNTTFGSWTAAGGTPSAGVNGIGQSGPFLSPANTVGTGQVIANVRNYGGIAQSSLVSSVFTLCICNACAGQDIFSGRSNTSIVQQIISTGAGAGGASGSSGLGFGYGAQGSGTWVQASGTAGGNSGGNGGAGSIIVTEFI